MNISIIISTYNNGPAFDVCLQSVVQNNHRNIEIILADDGTTNPDSLARIDKWCSAGLGKIIHAKQPDKGFRLARSRNNAVRFSTGKILLFMDHDIILPYCFIDVFLQCMISGWFAAARRVKLDAEVTTQVLKKDRLVKGLFTAKFAYEAWRRNLPGWRYLLPLRNRRPGGTPQYFKGMSGFCIGIHRKDFLSVDGFDNSFEEYGVEDWDFMARCNNRGIFGGYLPRTATTLHLWHNEKKHDSNNSGYDRLDEVLKRKICLPRSGYSSLTPMPLT